MDMLARREHSRVELTAKLCAKGFADDLAATVVAHLATENLVSDERFVEAFLRARVEKGQGPTKIAHELNRKGVDESLIEAYINFSDRAWIDRLRAVRHKKYGREIPRDWNERARQMRFLQGRGFTFEQIQRVMNLDD